MIRFLVAAFWRIALFSFGTWCSLVALFSPVFSEEIRTPFASMLLLLTLAAMFKPKIMAALSSAAMLVVVAGWYRLEPSNDRDWQNDLSKLAWAEQNGDEITIYNVRDFKYRTETDFDQNYVTKKVKLSELSSVDLFASYWAGKSIAHIFISFGFADKEQVAFSIEVRKTKTQAYSTIDGFFRNFELIYVVAEERDLVALRTIYRQPNEQVHLLRLKFYQPNAVKLFLQYIANTNALVNKPQFYNTLTTNCTTQVLTNIHGAGGANRFKYNWRLLLSGYTPEYMYLVGNLDSEFSIEELMQKGLVNQKKQDLSSPQLFSESIRQDVPRPARFEKAP